MDPRHYLAIDWLIGRDPHLAAVVDRFGRPEVFRRPPTFATLVLLILEQQVSLSSAAAAYGRLAAAGAVDPESLLGLDDVTLREFGFSRQKTRYVRALAQATASGDLVLERLADLTDDEVRSVLTSIPGIGPWTADVFLLSCLARPDVWPVGDRALQVGSAEVLGLTAVPGPTELAQIGERWRPLRSTAAQLIWHHYLASR
ncbi:MAG: DNA-3-methyladenine glycosylase 2 family protein, partial [Acidimicrobiia bacterium]